jgi:three-Cys-motif partner protein
MVASSGNLVLASDGFDARVVGVQSREKLHYCARYASIFNRGMQHKWQHRVYIDLFSGPGRCIIAGTREEIDGSPVLAARVDPPFTEYFLNDLDGRAISALRSRLSILGTSKVQYSSLDCNLAAEQIGQHLDAIQSRSVISLCFIDPTNWQITFESVRLLTRNRRMDLIVLFHHGAMKRAAAHKPEALSRFFGDDPAQPEWSRLYKLARGDGEYVSRALLDHYESRLREIEYVWFDDRVVVEIANNGAPLYHMLFASKSPRGDDFWGKTSAMRHDGQLRMAL